MEKIGFELGLKVKERGVMDDDRGDGTQAVEMMEVERENRVSGGMRLTQ